MRWRTARRISFSSRWMRITALTKHSPARSATISGSRPKRSALRRASIISSFRSRSSWIQPASTIFKPPRFETGKPLLVAGIGERYTCETAPAFPASGSASTNPSTTFPAGSGQVAYGVCCNGDDAGNFDYIAGVEVSDFSDLPREFSRVRIPERDMRSSPTASTSRPSAAPSTPSGITGCRRRVMKVADAPNFERYDEKFDPLDRQWRAGDLGAGQGVKRFRAKHVPIDAGWIPVRVKKTRHMKFLSQRRAALRGPSARGCLASIADFAITARNEIVARAEISLESACSSEKAGGFHVQRPRSRHRSRISGRAGGDAGRLGGAGRNPRPAADPGLARWPQGGGRGNSRRPQRRGARPRRQDVCLQQWRLQLDPDAQHDHAGPAAATNIAAARSSASTCRAARSRPWSTNAASIR